MRQYPIEQQDIDKAKQKVLERQERKERDRHKTVALSRSQKVAKFKRPLLPIVSIDEAARRLNDPVVWQKVSKYVPDSDKS